MPDSTPMVVALHGATGVQGAPVARRLLAAGHHVRALARHPEAAEACEPCPADLDDVASLARAYAGADAVIVQLPLVFDVRAAVQARNVLSALARSAPRKVVLNAGGPVPPALVGVPFLDARVLLARELGGVVVAPLAPYMENLAAPWVRDELAYPLPAELPVPWVAADDVAAEVVSALDDDGPAVRLVSGPQALSGPETGAVLGLPWRTISPREYSELMRPWTGPEVADGVGSLYAARRPFAPDPALLRTRPTDLAEWAGRFAAVA